MVVKVSQLVSRAQFQPRVGALEKKETPVSTIESSSSSSTAISSSAASETAACEAVQILEEYVHKDIPTHAHSALRAGAADAGEIVLKKVLPLCRLAGREMAKTANHLEIALISRHYKEKLPPAPTAFTHEVVCKRADHFLEPKVLLAVDGQNALHAALVTGLSPAGISLAAGSASAAATTIQDALLEFPALCKHSVSDREGVIRLWTTEERFFAREDEEESPRKRSAGSTNKTSTHQSIKQALFYDSILAVEQIYSSLHEVHLVSSLLVSFLGTMSGEDFARHFRISKTPPAAEDHAPVGGESADNSREDKNKKKIQTKVLSALRFLEEYMLENTESLFREILHFFSKEASSVNEQDFNIHVYATDVDDYDPLLRNARPQHVPQTLDDMFQDNFFEKPCTDVSLYTKIPEDFSGVHLVLVRGKETRVFSFYHD
ncbi:unnamed protein product [Amoebophrya sp. A120]|nr:unnamed protein product [Amoebophrya sp. A120]|eukprot:GSA120T00020210001.1